MSKEKAICSASEQTERTPVQTDGKDRRKKFHMSYLYICEQGTEIAVSENRFKVKYRSGMLRSIPVETLEVIELFGNVQMTPQCISECLRRGIPVIFYSTKGSYYGRLVSTSHIHTARQRRQDDLSRDEVFRIAFAKQIIEAKIKNQTVILRRYARYRKETVDEEIAQMQRMQYKALQAERVERIMGFEGYAARSYFKALGKLIDPDFTFTGRSRRPPRDPFNSLISLGYSIILNEIYGKLEAKGLNPYFGFIHADREKHPTLASDLMEEWRAVLIDATALSLLNGHELTKENFYSDIDQPGVYIEKEGFRTFIKKLEGKFNTKSRYLSYIDYEVNFRRALDLQINQLVKAIESGNPQDDHPLRIR